MYLPSRHPSLEVKSATEKLPQLSKVIKTGVFNARSARKKLAMIKNFCKEKDLIAISESWMQDADPSQPFTDSGIFKVARKDRGSLGGGVMAVYRSNLPFVRREDLECDGLELLFLELVGVNTRLLFGVFYRVPGEKEDLPKLQAHLRKLPNSLRKSLCLVGDFNCPKIDWSVSPPRRTETSSEATMLLEICAKFGLVQKVKEGTMMQKKNGKIGNLLDLILCNRPYFVRKVKVVANVSEKCDHLALDFGLHLITQPENNTTRYRWKLTDDGAVLFSEKLWQADWSILRNEELNIDTVSGELERKLLGLAAECFEVRKVPMKNLTRQRLSREACSALKQRDRLFRIARLSNGSADWKRYKTAARRSSGLVRRDHRRGVDCVVDGGQASARKFWNLVKQEAGSSGMPPLRINDDECMVHSSGKATLLNDYLASVYGTDDDQVFVPVSATRTAKVTQATVMEAIRRIPARSSSGSFLCTNNLIKAGGTGMAMVLSNLFSRILQKNTIPSDWKIADVIPIPKKGDSSKVENYRPIAMLPPMSKLLERIIHQQMLGSVSDTICPQQFGFRRGHSTEIQLALLVNKLQQALNDSEQIDAVSLDLSRAFDKVPHSVLLQKLQGVGMPAHLVAFVAEYLRGRQQRTLVEGVSSQLRPVTSGVPQGSILGPLLFLIFINDIPSKLSSSVGLFADDCLVYRKIETAADSAALQEDLTRLTNWATTNRMTFNATKSVTVTFTHKTKPRVSSYSICGGVIPVDERLEYLGLLLDAKLTFGDHLDKVMAKCRRRMGAIRFVFGHQHRDAKVKAFRAIVVPVIAYCGSVWMPWQTTFLARLERIMEEFARDIGMQDRTPEDLLKLTRILPPKSLKEHRRLLLLYKIVKRIYPGAEAVCVEGAPVRARTRATAHLNTHPCPLQEVYKPKKEKEVWKHGFVTETIKLWNCMNFTAKDLETVKTFKLFLARRFFP